MKEIDYNKIINYLLIGYAFALPISKAGVNIFETLILLTWIIQGNWRYKYNLYKKNLLFIGFFMLVLFSVISIPWASDTVFALDYIAKYRHFLIILPIYSSLDTKYIKLIFSAFLSGMFISEVMSYGIFFELWKYKNILPRDPSPFMSHVDYSVYLAFTSILLLTRLMDETEENIKLKFLYAAFFASSAINLFINGGRTGQVTFVVLIFISVLMSFKSKLTAFFISMVLIISTLVVAYNYSPNFNHKFNHASNGIKAMIYDNNYKSDGFSQRVSLWIVGVDNFKDNFLYGKGIGNDTADIEYYAQKRGFDPKFLSEFGDNHNMFLIIGLQLGIVGLIAMILIFYSIFRLSFISNVNKILSLTFIVGFFLWSLGNTTFHTMNAMVFFALFAGLFNKISHMEISTNKKIH